MPVKTRLQIRRDTASNWSSVNPTLSSGEIGYETDTGKLKVGNGSSAWGTLGYVAADAAILSGTTLKSTVINSSLTSVGTLSSLAVGGNITVGGDITGTGNVTLSSSANNKNISVVATGVGAASLDSSYTGNVQIGSTAGTTTIGVGSAANVINIGTGTGASRTINIGTNSSAKTITIGNTSTTSSLVLNSGSGGITLNDGAGDLVINNLTGYLYANGSSAVTASTTIPTTAMPSGTILQVQSVAISTQPTTTSNTPVNITGLSVTITPRSSSSKFFLTAMINSGFSGSTGGWTYFNFARSGTNLIFSSGSTANTFANVRHVDNATMHTTPMEYLDSPATTAAITYTVRWSVYSSNTASLNKRWLDTYFAGTSTLTVMEIA